MRSCLRFYLIAGALCILMLGTNRADEGVTIMPASVNPKKTGDSLVLRCSANTTTHGKPTLTWYSGKKGDVAKMKVSGAKVSVSRGNVLNLQFASLQQDHTDKYICRAQWDGAPPVENTIQIVVAPPVQWNFASTIIPLAEGSQGPVHIDCNVRNNPDIKVEVKPASDRPFPVGGQYEVEGGVATITGSISRQLPIQDFRCFAIQKIESFEVVDDRVMKLDIQYPPEFISTQEETVYGILNHEKKIDCVVQAANPDSVEFHFFKADAPLPAGGRYLVYQKPMIGQLKITQLEEDDFDKIFTCEASNSVSKTSKRFKLVKVLPPLQPKSVTLKDVGDDYVKLLITDPDFTGGEGVPITGYLIQYNASSGEKQQFLKKTRDSLYQLDGLKRNSGYFLRIKTQNDGGESDEYGTPVVVRTGAVSQASQQRFSNTGLMWLLAFMLLAASHTLRHQV